jgi:ATP-binding cassette, subfamily B, multidrug efflux pump
MALMFPVVMLVVNVSSVAVLWFGANRIAAGEMRSARSSRSSATSRRS